MLVGTPQHFSPRRLTSSAAQRICMPDNARPAVLRQKAHSPMAQTPDATLSDSGPLLIAIHGSAGAGKTTLAARFLAEIGADQRVVGWLQPALGARQASGGASAYGWQAIGSTAAPLPYLQRDDSLSPPYREQPEACRQIDRWLQTAREDVRPIDLLVVDEIGAIELAGGGHRARLEALRALHPGAILVMVGSQRRTAVEGMLGQRFDVAIDAAHPAALARLRDVLVARRDFERVGLFGALAGAIEVGAGSVVHGANLPFGGLGMATTQAALLTRAAEPMVDRSRVAWVGVLSAAIKSLSPAGQRLRPMLAIVVQAWLYARALRWIGWNLAGVMTGGFLMGVWAGSQGLLMQWLLLGDALLLALDKVSAEASRLLGWPTPGLVLLIAVWLSLHGAAVACGTALGWRRSGAAERAVVLPTWLLPVAVPPRRGWAGALRQALRDMLRPAFWLPLALVLAALAWAGQSGESLVWVLLRALLIAWVLFVLVQRLDLPALPEKLRRWGLWGPAIAWRRALTRLQAGGQGR